MPILGIMASQISGHLFAPSGAYDSIATTTLSTATASVAFSSIPQTYKHLQVRMFTRTSLAATTVDTYVKINTGTSYYYHYLYGSGASVAAGSGSIATLLSGRSTGSTANANAFAVSIIDILDYSDTTKNKTIRVLNGDENNGNGNVFFFSGVALATTAISTLTFTAETASNYVQYSHFALYGIKG